MIECHITDGGEKIASVYIEELYRREGSEELCDYDVNIRIDKGDTVGAYRRVVYDWPRNATNSLALVKAALALVDTDMTAIEGEPGAGISPDMERGLSGIVRALSPGSSTGHMRNHRSPVRRGQSVQHGSDSLG